MKIVATFSTPAEAHVALTRLECAGLDVALRDEFVVTLSWMYSNAIGGVKLEAVEDDVADARELLALPPPEEGILRCPFCGSFETGVRVLSVFGAICIFLKLPIPMTRAVVDCRACKKTHDVAIDGRTG